MEIFAAPYTLIPLRGLNSRTAMEGRPGALLKVVSREGVTGFADLHPWPVLGDLPLNEQLSLLSQNRTTPLSARSLKLAALDAEARLQRVSAFTGLQMPRNHFLVTDMASIGEEEIQAARASGFDSIKLKVGRAPPAEISRLTRWSSLFSSGLKLRLDFNGAMSAGGYMDFLRGLPIGVRSAIEFVEDPMPWEISNWRRIAQQAPLALDRVDEAELAFLESERDLAVEGSVEWPFDWLILKPAIQDPERIARLAYVFGKKIAVTSYMDHPVGQMGAALEAARLAARGVRLGVCGLASHTVFEKSEFSEQLRMDGSRLVPPHGSGIGFDDLLAAQDWKRIL